MQLTQNRTFEVPDEALNQIACDLITAACEGGINYWASCEDYRWGDPSLGHSRPQANGSDAWQPDDKRYATVTIHSDVDPGMEPDFEPVFVDAAKMIEAIRKVVAGEVKPFYNMGYTQTYRDRLVSLFAELERGVQLDYADYDYDASDADCMMQIAVLGETVYG